MNSLSIAIPSHHYSLDTILPPKIQIRDIRIRLCGDAQIYSVPRICSSIRICIFCVGSEPVVLVSPSPLSFLRQCWQLLKTGASARAPESDWYQTLIFESTQLVPFVLSLCFLQSRVIRVVSSYHCQMLARLSKRSMIRIWPTTRICWRLCGCWTTLVRRPDSSMW